MSNIDEFSVDSDNLALHQYYFRTLVCFATGGTLAASLQWETVHYGYVGAIIFLLLYTVIAYQITKRCPDDKRPQVNSILSYLDAGLIGVVVTLVDFSIIPTALFFTMVQFNALLQGGTKRWVEENIAFAIGVGTSWLIYQPTLLLSSSVEISTASLIGIVTYFLAHALFIHKRLYSLQKRCTELESDNVSNKVKAYKLSRFISPPVWNAINTNNDDQLAAERKHLTIFFSDIKDFSQLSEELEAETLTDILNTYLHEMSKIIDQYGGTIDKFMGDGIMVMFGDDASEGPKSDALKCLSMAIAMRRKMNNLQQIWFNQGIQKPLQIRMGINSGYCTVGTFGTSTHLDYTVLGTHVNLASRLESVSEPGEILISYETWSMVKDSILCRDKGHVKVKGFSHPVKVYQVVDFRKDLGSNQNYFEHRTSGFSMHMDLDEIANYDQEKVVEYLREVADKLEDKVIA